MNKFTVTIADAADRSAWQAFVEQVGVDHHAFDWAWREIIADVFKHRPYYYVARAADGTIHAVAPLFLVKSPLFGTALISVPYVNAGGIVATSPESYQALLDAISELARSLRVDRVELRHRAAASAAPSSLQLRTHKVAMLLTLENDAEALFSKFTPKLRSQIRRPSKSGVYTKISRPTEPGMAQHVHDFYAVFAENMRDLGTPVYPKRLFEKVMSHFGARARIITAWHEEKPVAAGLTIGCRTHVEIPWASSLRKHNSLSPNMLMYWDSIKTACEDQYRYFDFGRSTPDSGTFRFKAQWGAEPLSLHWYYLTEQPIPDVNPNSPKYRLLVTTWQKLPLPLANLVGPYLTRGLP